VREVLCSKALMGACVRNCIGTVQASGEVSVTGSSSEPFGVICPNVLALASIVPTMVISIPFCLWPFAVADQPSTTDSVRRIRRRDDGTAPDGSAVTGGTRYAITGRRRGTSSSAAQRHRAARVSGPFYGNVQTRPADRRRLRRCEIINGSMQDCIEGVKWLVGGRTYHEPVASKPIR
jgi:hypothetical protein